MEGTDRSAVYTLLTHKHYVIGRPMFEESIVNAWADLRDQLIPLAKSTAEVRAAPPRHAAEFLRDTASRISAVDESNASKIAAAWVGDPGSFPHPTPLATTLETAERPSPADEFLGDIYGDQYHTDSSAAAQADARSLIAAPARLHRIVAAHMRESPHGGIWLGDSGILDLGHPIFSAHRGVTPLGWPPGSSFNDLRGAYDPNSRAVLLGGHDKLTAGINGPLHELGHAADYALGRPSQAPAFAEVHSSVLPLIRRTNYPGSVAYFAQAGEAGTTELFGEGLAWFYGTEQPESFVWFDHAAQPSFLNSVAAGYHLTDYYQALESKSGITA